MMYKFECSSVVHVGLFVNSTTGNVVEYSAPGGVQTWRSLVDREGLPVEYDGVIVRLFCEKRLGWPLPVLLRQLDCDVKVSEGDINCMACIAFGVLS